MSIEKEQAYYQEIIENRDEPAWEIGKQLSFATIPELETFENEVILPCTDKYASVDSWLGRVSLASLIAVKRFYGSFRDITLTPIETYPDGLAKLASGSIMGKAQIINRLEKYPKMAHTFSVEAPMHSSGRGIIGALDFLLVYAPPPPNISKNHSTTYFERNYSSPYGICRYMTRPTKKDAQRSVDSVNDSSAVRAVTLYGQQMMRPMRG